MRKLLSAGLRGFCMRFLTLFWLLLCASLGSWANAGVPPVLHLSASRPINPLAPYLTLLTAPPALAPSWNQVYSGALDSRFRPFSIAPLPYQTDCWLRARLQADNSAATSWVLELAGAGFHQRFDVYLVEATGHVRHFSTHPEHPTVSREVQTRHFSLRLPLQTATPTDLYIHSDRGGRFAFTVAERTTLIQKASRNDLFDGLYLGLLLGLICYNLLLFFAVGDRGYLYYVVFTASFGLIQVASIGWWGVLFGGGLGIDAPWNVHIILLSMVMGSALQAARSFLELPQRSPGLDRWLRRALWLTLLPLLPLLSMRLFFEPLTSLLQLIISLLILGATVSQFRAGYRPARYLLVGWGLLLVAIIVYSLRELNLLPWNWISTYGVRVASAIETILFSLGLADRINLARRDRLLAEQQASAALREKEASQLAANETLRQRADELQIAYNELSTSLQNTDRLRALDEAKTRFFTNVSHELRTPLTLILGPIEELRQGRILPEAGTFDLLYRQASRLLALINQLLDVARLEAGKLQLNRQPLDAGAWLRLRAETFASAAASQGLALAVSIPTVPVIVEADAEQLEKILDNLLGNALKFTPSGGRITVDLLTTAGPAQALLTVQDTGPGIAPHHLTNLFDRFYQADDSASRIRGGSGIGLALVKELTELHGGTVGVTSTPGEGTCFTVALPLSTANVPDAPPETFRPASLTANPPEPIDILITQQPDLPLLVVIDDHDDMRTYLTACLAPDYRIITAPDGEAGLDLLAATIPDLVITDLMMPCLDGLEFCRRLRADERTSHIPLILLTARTDDATRLQGLTLGADDFLHKPFSAPELRTRVANLLAQRRQLRERFSRDLLLRPANIAITPADEVFLRRVLAVAEQHLGDADFDVEAFAQALALSRTQLFRKLKGLTNQSPVDFLRAFRLQRAADILIAGGPVAEVAYAVGFNSMSYFAKCFREQYGYPPSEHARRLASINTVSSS